MRLSSLCLAAVFLISSVALAQHSSGGGGSSGGSSGGGGGGSSGGSSSSGSSGGSHSSGGSGSHASSGHSSSSGSSHSGATNSHANSVHSIREPNAGGRGKTETPEKKSFFSFLRHPFRKPEPKPEPKTKVVADLRRPICFKGPCPVCPSGQARAGGCGVAFVPSHKHHWCSAGEVWNGGACLMQTPFLDDCAGLRMTLQRQEQRMRAAQLEQRNACTGGLTQRCSDLSSAAQSEAGLYQTLQNRYQTCMQRSLARYPLNGFGFGGHSAGLPFAPLQMELDYP